MPTLLATYYVNISCIIFIYFENDVALHNVNLMSFGIQLSIPNQRKRKWDKKSTSGISYYDEADKILAGCIFAYFQQENRRQICAGCS